MAWCCWVRRGDVRYVKAGMVRIGVQRYAKAV